MKDKILSSYFEAFCEDYNFPSKETDSFEHFANYSVFSRFVPSRFDFSLVHVGSDANYGIDGLGIVLNNTLIYDKADAQGFFERCQHIDAEFLFVQAKTSDSFDSGDFLKTCSAVADFFENKASMARNTKAKDYNLLSDIIFKNAIRLSEPPKCHIYYVYTGSGIGCNADAIIAQQKTILNAGNRFSEVTINIIDAEALKSFFKETKNQIERTLNDVHMTSLPKLKGANDTIKEAFIGVISGRDFLSLITDEDKNIIRSLFSENVRDFQGMNPVNSDIENTIKDKVDQNLFPIFNNGVTIVASKTARTSTDITIKNYQIVNGCQSSYVLFNNTKCGVENIYIPVKIISTEDSETINKIIKATNWQTQVPKEAFETTRDFHKRLEEFFMVMNRENDKKIYYERRSKQYNNTSIHNHDIVTMPILLKCYMSLYMYLPHATHQYYGQMLIEHRKGIFNDRHKTLPYYVSAFLFKLINEKIMEK